MRQIKRNGAWKKAWGIFLGAIVLAWLVWSLLLRFAGVPLRTGWIADNAFADRLARRAMPGATVDFAELTQFPWDQMFYEGAAYRCGDQLEKAGVRHTDDGKWTNTEQQNSLFFLRDNTVIRHYIVWDNLMYIPWEYLDEAQWDGTAGMYDRKNAMFHIDETGDWIPLHLWEDQMNGTRPRHAERYEGEGN